MSASSTPADEYAWPSAERRRARRSLSWSAAWVVVAVVAPALVALALIPVRDAAGNANVALVLVVVVVAVAVRFGRAAGAVAAVASALAFDVVHTLPYWHVRIASGDDVVTTALLLAVGLIVGHVATRGRVARRDADASSGEVRRIYRLATLAARGDDPADLLMAAQSELSALLRLRGCRFEAPPFASAMARMERGGAVAWRAQRSGDGFELPPEGVELPVMGRGSVLGRFVLDPTPGTGVSLEQRVVAVALADQVGAALAATHRERRPYGNG